MRSLLLVALCCVCFAFSSPILPPRRRRNTEDTPSTEPPELNDSSEESRVYSTEPPELNNSSEESGAYSTEKPELNNSSEEARVYNNWTNLSWFDRIHKVNNGSFIVGKFRIKHLDIAYDLRRSAAPCQNNVCLWPSSPDGFVYIPYSISSDLGSYETTVITASLSDIQDATCIRFKQRTSETDYINFVVYKGCWSSLGRTGGAQQISLDKPDCIWSGIVTHEVLHALGLHHEHVRQDRDQHVQVQWDNIISDAVPNFQAVETYNKDLTVYDYGSIMHYTNTAYSINGILPTLVAVPNSNIQLGQQFSMSYLDILKVNSLYKCKSSSESTTKTTQSTTTTTTHTTRTTRTTRSTTTTTPTTTRTTTTTTPTTTTTTTVRRGMMMTNGCGGNLTGSEGILTSPGFPNIYPNNAYCHWNITTNVQFRITFTDFDIEGDGYNCQFDKLKIYNGRDFDMLYQLRDLCGKNLPSPIISYGNSMQIVFTSDSSASEKGFKLFYKPVLSI